MQNKHIKILFSSQINEGNSGYYDFSKKEFKIPNIYSHILNADTNLQTYALTLR